MHCLITICSKEKNNTPGEIPAVERYLSSRIASVYERSRREGVPMLIFSGRYGLIDPQTPIPYYDHLLQAEEVEGFVAPTAEVLSAQGVTAVTFVARPREEAGWENYYRVIERACAQADISLKVEIYSNDERSTKRA
jgi:hypothetical protein